MARGRKFVKHEMDFIRVVQMYKSSPVKHSVSSHLGVVRDVLANRNVVTAVNDDAALVRLPYNVFRKGATVDALAHVKVELDRNAWCTRVSRGGEIVDW